MPISFAVVDGPFLMAAASVTLSISDPAVKGAADAGSVIAGTVGGWNSVAFGTISSGAS